MPPSRRRNKRVAVGDGGDNVDQSGKKLKSEDDRKNSDSLIHTNFSDIFREVIGEEIEELEKFVKYKHNQVLELEKRCLEYNDLLKEKKNENLKLRESLLEHENLR